MVDWVFAERLFIEMLLRNNKMAQNVFKSWHLSCHHLSLHVVSTAVIPLALHDRERRPELDYSYTIV